MKSQHDANQYETACKNCLFAEYEGDTQTGCAAGRIKKYQDNHMVIEAYDNEKEFFVIKGICNLVRQDSWNDGKADVSKALEEIKPKFSIIIDGNNLSDSSIADIIKFHDESDGYDCDWHVVHNFDVDKAGRQRLSPLVTALGATVTQCADTEFTIGHLITKSRRSFTIVLDQMSLPDAAILSKIDTALNKDLKKFVVYNYNGVLAVSNLAFHIYHSKTETFNYVGLFGDILTNATEMGLAIVEISE